MKGRLSQVFMHIAGCVTFLALPIVFCPDASNLSDLWKYPPALKDFLVYPALLLFFYFNYFWLIPNYYFKGKYAGFSLITALCFVAIVLIPNVLTGFHGKPPHAGYEWPANNPMPLPSDRPPRNLSQPEPPHPSADSLPPYAQESPGGYSSFPPDRYHSLVQHRHIPRSLLLDVSREIFLFIAVFFFSFALKESYRQRGTQK